VKQYLKQLRRLWLRLVRNTEICAARQVVLGSASIAYPGWTLTDVDTLNLLRASDFACYWQPGTLHRMLAEHVWEHLTESEGLIALQHCHTFLATGGVLRIAVPDGLHPSPAYREQVRPGGTGAGADDHKVLYDYRLLERQALKAGFRVQLLEYWDEAGAFHQQPWQWNDGPVRRSAQHDHRNAGGELVYTSLIADLVKP